MLDKIGLIPMESYIRNLDLRNYGRSMMINYTKKIYDIDISKEIESFEKRHGNFWNGDANVYEQYDRENPPSEKDDFSRKYFNNKQKGRFIKFIERHTELKEDRLIPLLFSVQDIHHIFPLVYGGSNKLLNLIYISKTSHDILHMNPLEHIEKYCYQACDYLAYLGSTSLSFGFIKSGYTYLNELYNLKEYKDSPTVFMNMYKGAIEEGMNKFYEYISYKNSLQIAV